MTHIRTRGRPFGKGQSGNPGGRPRVEGEIRELARQHTGTALRTLIEIAEHGENESARVTAANSLLDRGWGKPAVPVVAADPPQVITFKIGDRDIGPKKFDASRGRAPSARTTVAIGR